MDPERFHPSRPHWIRWANYGLKRRRRRMVRETSANAFREIKEEGLLSKRRFEVYECLFEHGPLTAKELYRKMKEIKKNTNLHDTFQQRLSELSRVGLVQELGTRRCRVTGRTVILWDVTKNLPAKFEKPRRRKCQHCQGRGFIEEVQAKLF
jgi:hypothetical protein